MKMKNSQNSVIIWLPQQRSNLLNYDKHQGGPWGVWVDSQKNADGDDDDDDDDNDDHNHDHDNE